VTADKRYALFGQSQPSLQLSQHAHSQLQFGQSLQQSFEQQAPFSQQEPVVLPVDGPAIAAPIKPAATARPPNNFTNI
jgi:hypothetical protein